MASIQSGDRVLGIGWELMSSKQRRNFMIPIESTKPMDLHLDVFPDFCQKVPINMASQYLQSTEQMKDMGMLMATSQNGQGPL